MKRLYVDKPTTVLRRVTVSLLILATAAGCSRGREEFLPLEGSGRDNIFITDVREARKGDLDEILRSRRTIRALVAYGKTSFAVVEGRPQGMEYDLLHGYQTFLDARLKRGAIKPLVVFIAVPREKLIPFLVEGKGDIAAGLAITPERQKVVAFTLPYIRDARPVVVAGRGVSGLHSLGDLSGRAVNVVAGSGDAELLRKLNLRLGKAGLRPARIAEADRVLEAEDLLEMVNSGILGIAVVNEYIADLWSRILPEIVVHKDILPDNGAGIGWAVRKENPRLLASLNEFVDTRARHGAMLGDILLAKYYGSTKWIRNPLAAGERQKLVRFQPYFEKYAREYGFDWLRIAAMAYQESHLESRVRSQAGAMGVMQMLPSTAREIGIRNIDAVGNNIHAGVKYLAYLRDTYFNDPAIAAGDKIDFALAAYNAGPDKIAALRGKATEMGLDPNRWFFNVEKVALREIGWETVQYVENIYKYYIAYKSAENIVREKIKLHGTR